VRNCEEICEIGYMLIKVYNAYPNLMQHSIVAKSTTVQCCTVSYFVCKAVVLEGKYWKRRLESVTAEYKKWRCFYKEHALHTLTNEDKLYMEEVCNQLLCVSLSVFCLSYIYFGPT